MVMCEIYFEIVEGSSAPGDLTAETLRFWKKFDEKIRKFGGGSKAISVKFVILKSPFIF